MEGCAGPNGLGHRRLEVLNVRKSAHVTLERHWEASEWDSESSKYLRDRKIPDVVGFCGQVE